MTARSLMPGCDPAPRSHSGWAVQVREGDIVKRLTQKDRFLKKKVNIPINSCGVSGASSQRQGTRPIVLSRSVLRTTWEGPPVRALLWPVSCAWDAPHPACPWVAPGTASTTIGVHRSPRPKALPCLADPEAQHHGPHVRSGTSAAALSGPRAIGAQRLRSPKPR